MNDCWIELCVKLVQKSVWELYGVVSRVSGWRLIIIVCEGVNLSYGLNMEPWACELVGGHSIF